MKIHLIERADRFERKDKTTQNWDTGQSVPSVPRPWWAAMFISTRIKRSYLSLAGSSLRGRGQIRKNFPAVSFCTSPLSANTKRFWLLRMVGVMRRNLWGKDPLQSLRPRHRVGLVKFTRGVGTHAARRPMRLASYPSMSCRERTACLLTHSFDFFRALLVGTACRVSAFLAALIPPSPFRPLLYCLNLEFFWIPFALHKHLFRVRF